MTTTNTGARTMTTTEIAPLTTLAALCAELDEDGPITVEILGTPVMLDVFEFEGRIRLALSTLEGDDRATVFDCDGSDFYVDAVNNALGACGYPWEWPLWDRSIRVNS